MASLLDELAKLVDPTPAFPDPEDDARDDTSARVIERGKENFEYETSTSQPSKLRQKVGLHLADFGAKYAGKKISRKKLRESEGCMPDESEEAGSDYLQMSENDSDSISNDDDDDDDDVSDEKDSDEQNQDDRELEQFKAKLNKAKVQSQELSFDAGGDFSHYADDFEDEENDELSLEEEEDEDEDNEESELEEEGDDDEGEEVQEESGFQQFSKTSAGDEVEKGLASRQQLGLWDSLLEGRIKLQKAVAVVNQLPHPDAWMIMEQTGEENFTVEAKKAQHAVRTLLNSLIQLQTLLLLQNMESRPIVQSNQSEKDDKGSKSSKAAAADDDEEITSESDMEVDKPSTTTPPVSSPVAKQKKRKLQIAEFPEFLEKRHKAFAEFRDNTIQKWNDKTRLAGGKIKGKSFSAFEQSALAQIQQILSDKQRLIRRTQLKRSVYQVVGQSEKLEQDKDKDVEDPTSSKDNLQDYDPEIFDDDDFYHQMLRELIERKTSDISDPIAISRQWLEIQKLRNKVKKKVDTKASKGRKIRYDMHKKLINFMASYENSTWPDESRDDLFKSLFGKRFQSTVTEKQ